MSVWVKHLIQSDPNNAVQSNTLGTDDAEGFSIVWVVSLYAFNLASGLPLAFGPARRKSAFVSLKATRCRTSRVLRDRRAEVPSVLSHVFGGSVFFAGQPPKGRRWEEDGRGAEFCEKML